MCGILGSMPSSETDFFQNALARIAHRGPDGFGIWHQNAQLLTLGHRRLAILDLSEAGKQPMSYGQYTLTFNGEIYNFIEIQQELEKKGYQFQSHSDSEVLIAAYDCWGTDCLKKFNGMWAFALWDEKNKILLLSRDRYGKKPLFYSFDNHRFVFGSEMKALTPFLKEAVPADNFSYFVQNQYHYESTENCLIKGIYRFPAGAYAFIKPEENELKPVKFWNTLEHLHAVPVRYEEQTEMLRELFLDACKIRMRSDVPVGTALSGGVDSSCVISAMAHIGKNALKERVSADWQHAYVASYPQSFIDESYYAKKVTDNLNIPATFIPINPADGIKNIENYLYLFEELYPTTPFPMMDLYGGIKKGGTVVSIDGHGADELLSGYGLNIYEAFYDSGLSISKIKNLLNTYQNLNKLDNEEASRVSGHFEQTWEQYYGYIKMQTGGPVGLGKYYLKELLGKNVKEKPSEGQFGRFNQKLFTLFHQSVLPTLLRNYDRYAMSKGVEIRMPFLDYRIVNFCFSLPWESKLRGGYTKKILRDAMKDMVPDEVLYRKFKIGFGTPFVEWMKNEWKDYLLDVSHSQNFLNSDFIDGHQLNRKILSVIAREQATFEDGQNIWQELVPYFWEQYFLKNCR